MDEIVKATYGTPPGIGTHMLFDDNHFFFCLWPLGKLGDIHSADIKYTFRASVFGTCSEAMGDVWRE